jgi:hypothetical protein
MNTPVFNVSYLPGGLSPPLLDVMSYSIPTFLFTSAGGNHVRERPEAADLAAVCKQV